MVLSQMLRDNATRLFRSEGGATYSPMETVDFSTFLPDYGFIGVAIEVAPNMMDEVQSKIQGIATDLATTPVPESEIQRIIGPKDRAVPSRLYNQRRLLDGVPLQRAGRSERNAIYPHRRLGLRQHHAGRYPGGSRSG